MSNPEQKDDGARRQALDPGRSFIVQAPAGSGKTGLLTQRFLLLLARVAHPEEVVAVTFTRKAAAEMRGRVLQSLASWSGPAPERSHDRLTWELAGAVMAVDRAQGWGLVDNPGRLRILTLDALCAHLTRQMPVLSGFGGQPAILADAEPVYRLAARATLGGLASGAAWGWAVRVVLAHLDNDRLAAEQLLADLLARRDQWLRHVVAGPDRAGLEAALAQVVTAGLQRCREQWDPGEDDQVVRLGDFAARQLALKGHSPLQPLLGLDAMPPPAADCVDAWRGLSHFLLTKSGEWRRRITVLEGFPTTHRAEKQAMAALLAVLSDNEGLRQALLAVRLLPPVRYQEGQWRVLEALLTLLPVAAAQLWVIFSQRRETDFSEISQRAMLALGSGEAPTDLALRLDYRLRHLLVDEVQDTSVPQYRLLERLTAGWGEGDGRTLFLVGDPMQSIYRFREAEVGLFLMAWQRGIGSAVRLHPLTLQVNFRSCQQVVDWVNGAFLHILPERNDPLTGAVGYVSCLAHHGAAGEGAGVHFHPLVGATPEEEAERVVALARAALENPAHRSVAILARSRSHLPWILEALRQGGVAHQAVEIGTLGGRMVVQDLLSLTRAVLQPADRLSWLALLRGPWCGLSLGDLEILAAAPADGLWSGDEAGLSPTGRVALQRVMAVMNGALARRRRGSLRLLVEGCWIALGGPATLGSEVDWADVRACLDLLESMEEAGEIRDLEELQRRLDHAPTPGLPGEGAGVQVMTIHRAKGLEFDCVILPGLARPPRHMERRLLLWEEIPGEEPALLLAPVRRTGQQQEAIFDYLQWLEESKSRLEVGRLLYVAVTRARRVLHLVTRLPEDWLTRKPAAGTFLEMMWEVLAGMMEAPPVTPAAVAPLPVAAAPAVFSLRRLPSGWTAPPPPAPLVGERAAESVVEQVLFEWAGESLRLVGVVVHRLLRRMAQEGAAAWDDPRVRGLTPAITAHLQRLGLPEGEMAAARQRVLEALRATLGEARGRWLLSVAGEAELALTGWQDGVFRHVVIDRTFVDEAGVRWIVDFKTGYHHGPDREEFLDNEQARYRQQLEGYARLFATLDPRPIRLGLYFPLMNGWREWDPAQESL